MTHLFKLKKDGKTVGFMKFAGAKPLYQKFPFPDWHTNNNFTSLLCNHVITELSIHPFVCKDKNSKYVWVGDKISFIPAEGFGTKKRQIAEVYYCFRRLGFCVKSRVWDIPIKNNCKDIELVKTQGEEVDLKS